MSEVVVLIDREQGGESRLASNNLRLHAAFTLSYILEVGAGSPVTASTARHPSCTQDAQTWPCPMSWR